MIECTIRMSAERRGQSSAYVDWQKSVGEKKEVKKWGVKQVERGRESEQKSRKAEIAMTIRAGGSEREKEG